MTLLVAVGTAGAATSDGAQLTAIDQIATSLSIPITSPTNGVSIPNSVLVTSATLSNEFPNGSHHRAPKGELYLSLEMSSAPVKRIYGDPLWGRYFSDMTPLPSAAVTFSTQHGRNYGSARINVTTPDPNSTGTDDGLVEQLVGGRLRLTTRRGDDADGRRRLQGEGQLGEGADLDAAHLGADDGRVGVDEADQSVAPAEEAARVDQRAPQVAHPGDHDGPVEVDPQGHVDLLHQPRRLVAGPPPAERSEQREVLAHLGGLAAREPGELLRGGGGGPGTQQLAGDALVHRQAGHSGLRERAGLALRSPCHRGSVPTPRRAHHPPPSHWAPG